MDQAPRGFCYEISDYLGYALHSRSAVSSDRGVRGCAAPAANPVSPRQTPHSRGFFSTAAKSSETGLGKR